MILISDRRQETEEIPLTEFLCVVFDRAGASCVATLNLLRIGGVGNRIWKKESALDHGDKVSVSAEELRLLACDPDEAIDELLCIAGELVFGLSDSSFLFVQCADKEIETAVGLAFEDVRELPDRNFS